MKNQALRTITSANDVNVNIMIDMKEFIGIQDCRNMTELENNFVLWLKQWLSVGVILLLDLWIYWMSSNYEE